MLNFKKFMSYSPYNLGRIINSKGQLIEFFEHPTMGDGYPIVCVCQELQLAASSGFYDTYDMETPEYEPSFVDGKLVIGDL